MATAKQELGALGEKLVAKKCPCPRCKGESRLKRLSPNFKCADLVCDFCGFLAQVKSITVSSVDRVPSKILGAAWSVQKVRMNAGIYFPLYIVLVAKNKKHQAIYYLSADLQPPGLFVPRKPLKSTARRAGWQGFVYDLTKVTDGAIVRLWRK